MAKAVTKFVCQACGSIYPRWVGKCEQCGEWNSLIEEVSTSTGGLHKTTAARPLKPAKLSLVTSASLSRLASGIDEVDQVLGGGIVPGSVMLLSGDPGIGKSTLVLQIAASLAASHAVLYVSGEESVSQIKLRADRLGLSAANLDLLAETNVDAISATIAHGSYQLVIIDSIQTMGLEALTGAPGTVGQITASAQSLQAIAKSQGVATLIIGHVTKEGNIAGPKILEHLVDVVLYLEGERYGAFKALRGIKNRFGSTSEVGIFEMTELGLTPVANPSQALLAERRPGPGSIVLATLEGSRPLLVEVQALVSSTSFGYPKRTAVGFDLNRLNMLVAVVTKRAALNLSSSDIYVNIVGGLRVSEPAADLAIILSIASAFKDTQVPANLVTFGEVGLSGEIRSVGQVTRRVSEATRLGYSAAIGPIHGAVSGMTGVASVAEAVARINSPVQKI
ncbi:MAG TPA: DNA repair protein RadA [Candidatus Saccharimonadia bacterium]|nr:DNA repair protein RadA [Candidatus Saccharimonadia bacterium]